MGEIDHFTYGPVTPALAYGLSVLGAVLGLTCTVKAREARSPGRRSWYLLLAAWAIGGTGIWAMHFMAMLGFGVTGAEIRYDVPLTVASALLAIAVVAAGLFIVGFGRSHPIKIVVAGALAGMGIAVMHYTGMAGMHLNGTIEYDERLRAASVVIALVAATAALWLAVTVRRIAGIIGSALVMGVAVCGMHYVGMYAMSVHLHSPGQTQRGMPVFALILPILLLVLLVIVGLVSALLAAPNPEDQVDGDLLSGNPLSGQSVTNTAGQPASAAASQPQPQAAPNVVPNPHSTSLAEISGRRPPSLPPGRRQLGAGSFPAARRRHGGQSAPPPEPTPSEPTRLSPPH